MKKTIVFSMWFFLLFSNYFYTQQYNLNLSPSTELRISRTYSELVSQYTYDLTSFNYGIWQEPIINTNPPKYIYYNYHTSYQFDLSSIPPNAYNISATLEAWRGEYSTGSSKIVTVPDNLNFNNYSYCWYYSEIGDIYCDVDNDPQHVQHDITSLVLQKIPQGYINLGARQLSSSKFERGYIYIILHIHYYIPLNLTAKNNFEYGTIKVGVNGSPIQKNSPYTFYANLGQTVKLEAENQFYGGYERIWHTGTTNASVWERNGDFKSLNQTYSFPVAVDDDNKSYIANLRKNYKVDQIYITEFDLVQPGPTSWIVEQNNGQISDHFCSNGPYNGDRNNLLTKEDTTYKYWISVGGWIGKNVSLNFNYSFSLGGNFYKVGYFTRGGFSQNPSVGNDGYLFNTIDISVGKRLQSEWFQTSVFAGLSYVFGKKEISQGNYEKYYTLGLESDIQLLFRIADEIGLGVGLYGNLNFIKNYAGININLILGNGK